MKTRIRYANEEYPSEVLNFDITEFKSDKEFDTEVFGWWNDVYVSVNREDYDRLKFLSARAAMEDNLKKLTMKKRIKK